MDASKIAIKTSRGIEILRMEEILCCVARGRYTKIITTSGKEYMLTKVLKEIESCLPCEDFFRTHKSYLINLNHLIHYQNNHQTPITLQNNIKIQLAKRRKQDFQKKINEMVRTILNFDIHSVSINRSLHIPSRLLQNNDHSIQITLLNWGRPQ